MTWCRCIRPLTQSLIRGRYIRISSTRRRIVIDDDLEPGYYGDDDDDPKTPVNNYPPHHSLPSSRYSRHSEGTCTTRRVVWGGIRVGRCHHR